MSTCRSAVSALALVVAAPLAAQGATFPIRVQVDPRVELLCVVFRLAGNPEYNQPRVPAYAAAVDAHFGALGNHPAVQCARRLRAVFGVGYDAPMGLAIHLPGVEQVEDGIPFAPRPAALDNRWVPADTKRFLEDLQEFVVDSGFTEFLAAQRELHALTEQRLREVLAANIEMDWFASFFGERPTAEFTVIPGLLNGGCCYGSRVLGADGKEEMFSILGVWQTDADGNPSFDSAIVATVVHEFCHSFCNPIVEANLDRLRGAAEKIWPFAEAAMRGQAYSNWETMMKETLVRACTARYVAATRGDEAHRRVVAYEQSRGFEWTGELSALLARYESEREKYAKVGDFVPEIGALLDRYADEYVARQQEPPQVTAMTPANGARDVDPATTAIVVTFDRPMQDKSWSVVGGGPKMPAIAGGELRYDEARQVLTIPVQLKPATDYEFWLNRGQYGSFRSAEGVALRSVHVTFRTR